MPAPHRSPALRVPSTSARGAGRTPPPPRDDRPSLRLAASRGAIGIELDAPFRLGPVTLTELSLTLAGVRFPVDLSGGVARFRHRRGALERLAIEVRAVDLVRALAPGLRGLVADRTPDVVVAPTEAGALIGLFAGEAALAFDVVLAANDRDLRLLPERARGVGLGAPPHVVALRVLDRMARPLGRVRGGAVVLADVVAAIARAVLPLAGARAPSCEGVRWGALEPDVGAAVLAATLDAPPPPALGDRALRALETLELAGEADDLAYAGDLDGARARYLAALERAPRHVEIARRLAAVDASNGGRAEAALATLVEAMPALDAGLLGAELLAGVGDDEGARAALARAAEIEPYGPLAALAWLRVARASEEVAERLDALDQAVARAPALEAARWARLLARLDVADLRGAKGDAEHLEAAARGAHARRAVWSRAAGAFLARGAIADAASLFERALRYQPDDAATVAGLARSLRAAGQDRRALDLFARAAALGGGNDVTIDLALGLASMAGDLPAAIARVRGVPPGSPEHAEARRLEGRWRAQLGDLAAASLAFARARDAAELEAQSVDADRAAQLAAMLVEAAAFEERDRSDRLAAQRHLGVALRLRPRDRAVGAEFRRVARLAQAAAAPPADDDAPESLPSATVHELVIEPDPAPLVELGSDLDDVSVTAATGDDERLVSELTDRLRADPSDRVSAIALADALERLDRPLELLALLSARLDEGDDQERAELEPRRRRALQRLAAAARAAGRADEAELYEAMLAG